MDERVTNHEPERLMALLAEQTGLYRQLRDLSERQRGLIVGDTPEDLLTILNQRQTLVNKLARLNESLAPFRRDWQQCYAALSPQHREQAGGLLAEMNQHLQAILQADSEDSKLLSVRKQSVARDLRDVTGGRAANAAYGRAAAQMPRQADVQG